MRRKARHFLAAVTLVVAVTSPILAAEQIGPYEWVGVNRLVVFGDIHGSYDKLVLLLRGTKTIDSDLHWVGGDAHVVFCGDLVDRGPNERPVLDLIRRLETEAEEAGGGVHVLLGNHEVLNIVGDLRYVEGNGYSDFAADELAADRQLAFERFRSEASKAGVRGRQVREAFEERFPAGYFGRFRAFEADGIYGSWLLSKPAVVKINGYVFLHGGLTDTTAALGLEAINLAVKASVERFLDSRTLIADGALLNYQEAYAMAEALATNSAARRRTPAKVAAAETLLEHFDGMAFAAGGPLWYRGNSVENERIERASLSRVLESLGAEGVVVGHTPTGTGRITSRFDGKIHRVDVGMAYGRRPLCLVFEGGQIAVFDPAEMEYSAVPPEAPGGERYSDIDEQLPDKQLERFLRKADVVKSTYVHNVIRGEQRQVEIWDLESVEMDLRAVFQEVDEPPSADGSATRRYIHEIAAYKLDRLLGLNLVPVAVVRKVEGKTGSLQLWIHSAIDLKEIREYGREDILELLTPQIIQARIFVALLGEKHDDIAEAGRMALPKEKRVLLMDNTKAFATNIDIDELIEQLVDQWGSCEIEEYFELMLHKLERRSLLKELGAYLSAAQIDALLARRDRLLEVCGD